VTGNITVKDYSNRYHVTDIIAVQQQPENSKPAEKLNHNNRQDHGMINMEELLND